MNLTIALAGNPNSGKTTLFNALTGANQYVGNWPGVTVEKKGGKYRKDKDITITDLPGIYSLSPYTQEEVVARDYLLGDEKPDAIINIVDGTNLERNLYLTTQLIEIGVPVVVAVNMIDLVNKSGNKIDVAKLGEKLGVPTIELSALKKTNVDEALNLAVEAAKAGKAAPAVAFTGSVESTVKKIETEYLGSIDEAQKRWYAIKLFERDSKINETLSLSEASLSAIEESIVAAETEYDDDSEAIITNERYVAIADILKGVYVKKEAGALTVSDKIDKVVTNRILALPIFVVIMFIVYFVSVSWLGGIVTDFTNDTLFGEWIGGGIETLLVNANSPDWLVSLIVDGIIGGIGAPIGFAPQMAIVFLFLSILEDCGYMARVAFVMDRIFRRFGLSGKSFISFMIGTGCGVSGIMATRTIENEKDRRMTIITTTSMPCGAKLPVIALVAGYIMGGAWWFAPVMYFVAIAVIICACIILKKMKLFSGEVAPFVMELPAYHLPSWKNVLMTTWERVWAFLKKAGTILFLCCLVMWFLGTYGFSGGSFGMVDTEESLLATIGSIICIIFRPLGFDTWQAAASTLSGFVAKEGILSTMGLLSSLAEEVEEYEDAVMHSAFSAFFPTNIAAVSFLMFNIFNSPCLAAISTMAKEMHSKKYFWFALLFQNLFAYIIALMVYQIGGVIIGQVTFGVWTVIAIIIAILFIYLLVRPDPAKKKEKNIAAKANA